MTRFVDLTHAFLHDLDSRFAGQAPDESARAAGLWWPALDGYVKGDAVLVRCDLPGVDPKDIEVSLDGDQLKIAGERKHEHDKEDEGSRYGERRFGRFERTLTMPEGLDPEKIVARSTNGVLEVTLPLIVKPAARRVPVQVEVSTTQNLKKAA